MALGRLVVVKLGTGVLTAGSARLSTRAMLSVARQCVALREAGHSVVLVSSGAVAAGRERLGATGRQNPRRGGSVPDRQMYASVGQVHLMRLWSEVFGLFEMTVGQVLVTRAELSSRVAYLNARDTLATLLAHGVVPIVNENDTVATDEIRVGDNDNLSAIVANLVDADLLVILSDIDGLYTADPRTNPDARLISDVARIDDDIFALAGGSVSGLGTGGMRTKLEAAALAGRSGTVTVIARGDLPDVLANVVSGESVGTRFCASSTSRESRKRWLLAEPPHGTIFVDSGASARLSTRRASLLPVGISSVDGAFERGAVVKVMSGDGAIIAVGIAAYGADELRKILGKPSASIETTLGFSYGDEAIHRDNLALWEGNPL